jgi:CubicO group peptidase (beta-lactamase class C family)
MNSETILPATDPATGFGGRFARVYRVLDDAIAARVIPGCAFGVLDLGRSGGAVVLQDARGRFTYEDDSPAITAETVYDVASLTKVVATTAMAMLLWQRGLLDLETPLGELLPEFVAGRAPEDLAHRVTLRHLLAHNSGLPGTVEFFRTVSTPAALLHACLKLPLEADPGTRAEYSDPGFILLGRALEASTGESLTAWVEREIFQPLEMTATGFSPRREARSSIPPTEEEARPRQRGTQGRIQGLVQDENARLLGGVAGHAGVFANVPDLLRFACQMLTARSESEESRLFKMATVEAFARRQRPEGSSRALGWDTPSEKSSAGRHFSPHSIGHLGFSGCSLWIDLDAAVAVVLLTNRTWPDRQNQAIRQLRPIFHDAVREAL